MSPGLSGKGYLTRYSSSNQNEGHKSSSHRGYYSSLSNSCVDTESSGNIGSEAICLNGNAMFIATVVQFK